jgi:penicillin-binding protein 1A
VLLMGVLVVVCTIAIGGAAAVGWVVSVADSAPDIRHLKPRLPGTLSEVYAGDGSLLGYISSDILRTSVSQSQMPKLLSEATVAVEDRRFWQHGGVDYQGIVRAGFKDLLNGGTDVQGGSTLTMQLVGNIYLPYQIRQHHNLRYKIVQAKLANELEAQHSKSWILNQYLNDVEYGAVGGQQAIGVGAASQVFFDKPVAQLDLAQIALLAGLPQAPTQYNPFRAPTLARQRRSEVLTAMSQAGYITPAQERKANAAPLQVQANDTYETVNQPYVFDYVKQQLVQRFGQAVVDRGGMQVYTTINLHDQALALSAIHQNEGEPGDPAAALVSIDPTNGHILAMQNSTSYGQTNFNYAADAQRQTGSSFKPFVMMTLIHDYNGDPVSTYYDSHFLQPGWLPGYPDYSVHTSEETYQGSISVAHAMTVSDNTVFAQLGVDLGMGKVDAMAHAMGITSPLFGYPSEAIGGLHIGVSPLQMSDAYATLANGGLHITPTIISKVVFPDGSVVNLDKPAATRVFSDGEAYAGTKVLETVITSGTGTAAEYGCPAAGKTGTTSDYTDAWFVGYTPQFSTAVWVGYPNSTASMTDVNGLGAGFGGTLAAPIWHDYMVAASDGYCGDFPQPTTFWSGTAYFGAHSSSSVPVTPSPGPLTTTPGVTSSTASTTAAPTPATAKPTPPARGGPAGGGAPKSGGAGVP